MILVEKSLAYQKDNEEIGRVYKWNLKDLNNKDVSMTEEDIDLFNELAEKLIKYPLDYEKFYYLYDGNNLNEDINQRKQYLKNQIDGKIKLTKEKIANVIFHNKYQLGRNFIYYRPISKGIWGYASLINNDCLPNSTYFCIGKFFISYCIKEIKKGEEITIRYNNRYLTYEDRQEKLLKYWGFKCNCQLCEY